MLGGQIRVTVAEGGGADLARAVTEMTQVEAGARTERITRLRIHSSGLPCVKTLADSDWTFQPSVPRPLLEEISTLGFMERAENVLLVGSPGVGKTHLAVAIGVEAAKAARGQVHRLREARRRPGGRPGEGHPEEEAQVPRAPQAPHHRRARLPGHRRRRRRPAVPAGRHALRAALDDNRRERRHRRVGEGLRGRGRRQHDSGRDMPPLPHREDNRALLQAQGRPGGEEGGAEVTETG